MPDDFIHARIDAELKAQVVEYIEKNKRTCPGITAFVIAAIHEKLSRDALEDKAEFKNQLMDLLVNDPDVANWLMNLWSAKHGLRKYGEE